MAGYDTLTISSTTSAAAAPNGDILRLTTPDTGHLTMDAFDHDLNFEGDGLLCVPSFTTILIISIITKYPGIV
jgi:hypothetical protein